MKFKTTPPTHENWVIVKYENGTQIIPHYYNQQYKVWFDYLSSATRTKNVISWTEYPQ